ncbi:MAG: hypothetical protein IJO61_04595, partial [Oscillospiraceae bacterium]|nr:hypothetical protein [Oscillospiraceae bacterium]
LLEIVREGYQTKVKLSTFGISTEPNFEALVDYLIENNVGLIEPKPVDIAVNLNDVKRLEEGETVVVEMPFYEYVHYEKKRYWAMTMVAPDVLYVSERLKCHLIQENQLTVRKSDGKCVFRGCEVRVDDELPGISFSFANTKTVFITNGGEKE